MQTLFIHLHEDGASWGWSARPGKLPEQVAKGPLARIEMAPGECEVVVFVPSDEVVLTSAKVPAQSRQRLQQSLPYALEEQFIQDIEDMHVSVGNRDSDGNVSAAVVNIAKLDTWLDSLLEVGVEPNKVVPDVLALPRSGNDWAGMINNNIVTIRSGEQSGFCCDINNYVELAQRHAHDHDCAPDAITITNCNGTNVESRVFDRAFTSELTLLPCNGDPLSTLVEGYDPAQSIDLLQGRYKGRANLMSGGKRWIPAVAMCVILLSIQFGTNIYDYVQLSSVEDEYKQKITKIYKTTFPNAKRVVNPRVQMQDKLKKLRGSAASGDDFITALFKSSTVFSKVDGIEIEVLNYRNNTIDLDIVLNNPERLDALRKSFGSLKGLSAEIKSSSVEGNKLKSRIQIRSKK